ncbi:hypothetical protein IE81DRAFT_320789 [Ceraceosorus guamensis]|uniref:Thioredoxin-like protein n=1 Tax=Ceraceosorus guamensis TaxID=1522189 RepID=A0A316W5C4_9BASI|nr:hypothetical protein IE81DRAFT_320789 [Ceraceosorus guamensis]PWN44824.1 hypothetical protein IE81DRAFT_320789 [Ceraceosorus guamensis]
MTPRLVIRPYILDPRLPATSFEPPSSHYDDIASTNWTAGKPPSKKEYFEKKFTGGEEALKAFEQKIDKNAKEAGVDWKWTWRSENAKVGATWDAHRLVWLAGEVAQEGASSGASELLLDAAQSDDDKYPASRQEVSMERLYKAFHTTDDAQMDLSNRDYTSRLAHELGLFASVQEAKNWLESDAGDSELAQALMVAQMNGVQSVPFFVIQDGSDHLNGSGSYDEFMKMFDMAAALHR